MPTILIETSFHSRAKILTLDPPYLPPGFGWNVSRGYFKLRVEIHLREKVMKSQIWRSLVVARLLYISESVSVNPQYHLLILNTFPLYDVEDTFAT